MILYIYITISPLSTLMIQCCITFTIRLSPLRSLRMWTSTAVPIDLFRQGKRCHGILDALETYQRHVEKPCFFPRIYELMMGFPPCFHILVYKKVNMENEESTMKIGN